MSYLGIPPFGRTARTVTEVIATSGQTTFYPNGGYAVGYIDVALNGVQLNSADYTAIDGISIVLSTACVANDELRLTSYTLADLQGTSFERYSYIATANQTSFAAAYKVGYIQVYLNGVLLDTSEYTATNQSTVILSSGAPSGTLIDIVAFRTLAIRTVDWSNVDNKPTLFSGSYADLTNKPSLATVATSGSYADLTNKPTGLASTGKAIAMAIVFGG